MDGSELLQILRITTGGPPWAQLAFAIGWVTVYALWPRAYVGVLDSRLRRVLSGWVGAPVTWVRRRGSHHGGPAYFGPLYDTWTWGLAAREPAPTGLAPLATDALLYVGSVLVVYVVAAVWPVAVLYAAAFSLQWLAPQVVLVLFFLAIPLYTRFCRVTSHAAADLDALVRHDEDHASARA